jgi:hypothetical protein
MNLQHHLEKATFCRVAFEVFTEVVIKSSIFWDITSRRLVESRRIEATRSTETSVEF